MKVEVEKQPDSVSTLQIELPPDQVAKEWNAIAGSFARFAKIPGYRPGKAPRRVIEAKFRKEIQEELTKKLVSKSYRDAIEQEQLRVASLTNIEDVQFGEDKSMRFRATVVTAPEFDLPDCKWAILRCLILRARWTTSRLVKSRRRRARICKAVKNSGYIWRPAIFCRNFASSSSNKSRTKHAW